MPKRPLNNRFSRFYLDFGAVLSYYVISRYSYWHHCVEHGKLLHKHIPNMMLRVTGYGLC